MSRYHQLVAAAAVAVAACGGSASALSATCSLDGPLSCHNTTAVGDTCCFNYPGGQLLLTQFWDTDPATGPEDSWTIHGLWPDNCDGTWEQNCDSSREYTNITAVLQSLAPSTLQYMQTYWKDYQGDDESFWEHEFGKHGTCVSTLEPSCYGDAYQPAEEVADYFTRAVGLFQTLPSHDWLAGAGIVPSAAKTYTLTAIQAALAAHHGHDVIVNCNAKGELDELWYQYNVRGSAQAGTFVPADPVGSRSTCPSTGIKYLPKNPSGSPTATTTTATRTTRTTTTATATGTAAPFSGKGYLNVAVEGSGGAQQQTGFLISGGKWYNANGGTPATYTASASGGEGGFTLTSSQGNCAVVDSALTCASTVSAGSVFTADGVYLAYEKSTAFYAAGVPSGTAQGTVYTTPRAVGLRIAWEAR